MHPTDTLNAALRPLALRTLGVTSITHDDGFATAGALALIGPHEPHFWPHFAASQEAADGAPDPLDRWSRRVLDAVAKVVSGQAIYPFGGPPFRPFHSYALRSGRFWSSPIGFLVHDEAGLFVSFRGAILLPGVDVTPPVSPRPCDTCADRPCKTACPVGAFADNYDVPACKAHLAEPAGTDCMTDGCLARRVCPVGQGNRLSAQATFHMEAFR